MRPAKRPGTSRPEGGIVVRIKVLIQHSGGFRMRRNTPAFHFLGLVV